MPKRLEILSVERLLDGFFKIDRIIHRYERYDGTLGAPLERLVFERGDAAAVLPYDPARREVVLVQQFRLPAAVRGGPGWLWEIIAGMIESGRSAEEVARSEALEEAGYRIEVLQPIMTIYPSPGGSSERVHLFLATITPEAHVEAGGGVDEGEDILVRSFSLDETLAMVADGRIVDAKTVVALQYLALHWSDLQTRLDS